MRLIPNILIVTFLIVLFSFKEEFNEGISVQGQLRMKPKEEPSFSVGHLTILVKGGDEILGSTLSDSLGRFTLKFLPNEAKSFDFFCFGIGIDTILISSIHKIDFGKTDFDFFVPAPTKKNLLGTVTCPKCRKGDEVIKISYGDGLAKATCYINANGDSIWQPRKKGEYNAGTCIVGVAKYFCERDEVKF
jgi:hypothetical protein